MNIETIGDLRKALSKYSDETPLEFAPVFDSYLIKN